MSLFKQICKFEEVRHPDFDNDVQFSEMTGNIKVDIYRIQRLKQDLQYYTNIATAAIRRLNMLESKDSNIIQEDYNKALKEK